MIEVGNIKITVEGYGKKSVMEMPDDCDTRELIEAFTSQLYFLTFGYNAILDGLNSQVRSLETEKEF